jgi:hypothetical protein
MRPAFFNSFKCWEIVGWASSSFYTISAYTTVHLDEMLNNGNWEQDDPALAATGSCPSVEGYRSNINRQL